jgi:hypothetical protein
MTPIIMGVIAAIVFLFFCYIAYKTTPRKSKLKPLVIEPQKETEKDTWAEDVNEDSQLDGEILFGDIMFPESDEEEEEN